jgi:hypothetical protein
MLKKTFFAILLLVGLFSLPPVVSAHDQGHLSGAVSDGHKAALNPVYWGRHRGWYGLQRYYDNGYSRYRTWSCPLRYRSYQRRGWYNGPRYYGNDYYNGYNNGYYNGYGHRWWGW